MSLYLRKYNNCNKHTVENINLRKGEGMTFPVISLYSKCQSFPPVDKAMVVRENILDLVKSLATSECPVVFIEGDDLIGKTTFLMQFAIHECSSTISSFIDPSSKWAYNPDYIRSDLYDQIVYALAKCDDSAHVDVSMFSNAVYDLNKQAVRGSDIYYFIIDGLDNIPEEDVQIRANILALLPFGLRNFRFIISGNSHKLIDDVMLKKVNYVKCPLPGFSLDETRRYMNDSGCKSETIDEIYKITKKPGMLSAIKRLLITGQISENAIDELPNKLPSLLDIEWKQVDESNNTAVTLLAVIAFDKKVNTVVDLTRILNVSITEVTAILEKLSFISIEEDTKNVKYISEPFRKYVVNKLKDKKDMATNLIITELYANPLSGNSMNLLPAFLSETGNYGQLLNYMTPDYFSEMVKCCQSLSPIIKTAEIGVNAANTLQNNGELFRFGLQKSIICQLDGAAIWRSEIEANMALGDYSAALTLAQSTSTKEDRLHSLAIIAKYKREQGFIEDEEISNLIRQLFKEIDLNTLGDRGYEIAEDLIISYPELAIEIAEKVSNQSDGNKSLDMALTKMSIATLGSTEDESNTTNFEAITSRIKNRSIKDFLNVTSVVFGDYTVSKLLSEIKKLESKSDALMLLRQWLKVNRKAVDSHIVIEYALDLTISTSEYSPNATDFKEIAAPLPFITDVEIVKTLLSKLDSQKGIVEKLGPTEDYVRFEVMLASSALKVELENARDRFIEVYYYINSINDIVIRGGCYAYLLTMLSIVDVDKRLETKDNLHSLVNDELKHDIKIILDGTAHQFEALKKIIYSITKNDIAHAISIAESLNTQHERNKGYCEILRSAVTGPFTNLDMSVVEDIVNKITDNDIRDESYLRLYDYVHSNYEKHPELIDSMATLFTNTDKICHLELRCRAICLSYNVIYSTNNESIKALLIKCLERTLGNINVGWIRIDAGYKIVKQLAKVSKDIANDFMVKVTADKQDVFIESDTIAVNYISCVYLALRAFSGLIYKSIYSDEDIDNICQLINDINSDGERAKLLSVLAMYFYKYKKHHVGEKIVMERVRPLLENIKDEEHRSQIIIRISVALYYANSAIADAMLSSLSTNHRDDAYYNICRYYLTKAYYVDPFEDYDGYAYKCEYNDILNICNIIDKIDTDNYIYVLIDDVTATIKKRKDDFTRQQKEEIARKLNGIVNRKLPNPSHIKHDGYKVISIASIARITNFSNWDDLILQSKNIPNLADKALVLAVVFTCLPTKQRDKHKEMIDEIKDTIKLIPSIYDQMHRYESIASTFKEIDNTLSIQCLRSAMDVTASSSDPEIVSRQKRIVDLAARIDTTLAASFTKIYDDDPARINNAHELKEHFKVLELKKSLVNELLNPDDLKPENLEKLPLASWKALGSLNTNMVETLKIEKIRELVKIASSLSMDKAYPILCLSIQNLVNRYAKTGEATTIIKPTYEAILMSCRLSKNMASRSTEIHKNAYKRAEKSTDASIYIKSGQREKAMTFLTDWLQANIDEYLKICDPYFGTSDLEILRIVRSINPNTAVFIVTSREHQDKQLGACDLSETYSNYWKYNISEQSPPETEIIVAGLSTNGKLPIHDRWIITKKGGLRIGTSINSIGKGRDSEISTLTLEETNERETQIDAYIRREKKEHDSTRMRYATFTL